jgi:hypothetical protein
MWTWSHPVSAPAGLIRPSMPGPASSTPSVGSATSVVSTPALGRTWAGPRLNQDPLTLDGLFGAVAGIRDR